MTKEEIEIANAYGYHGVNQVHKHQNLTFDYKTVGIPSPGRTYNFRKIQP